MDASLAWLSWTDRFRVGVGVPSEVAAQFKLGEGWTGGSLMRRSTSSIWSETALSISTSSRAKDSSSARKM
jgi:hypothetical protein